MPAGGGYGVTGYSRAPFRNWSQAWVLRQFDEGRQTSIEGEKLAPVADRGLTA